ncbi:MAG: hypothetical protein ACLTQS_04245 [Phocaeicola plebeius]
MAPSRPGSAGVTAKASVALESCSMVSRKPFRVTVMPVPFQRTEVLSADAGTLLRTVHVRCMMCHRVSAGEV